MSVRRLIETDKMPIRVISEHARKDQNVRKGHLHTLHVWWATRPLAACRAVLMATLLPDPADENCPESFRQQARDALKTLTGRDLSDPLALRQELLEFIGHFAAWENATRRTFVETARRLVAAAHPEGPPLVVDPFAGIGSIPFEALRIGAEAFAGDLNPVAVLLNRVTLEYLPRYGQGEQEFPPLHEAVRKWGAWVRKRAVEELRPFYPLEPDGAEPLAYLWARTVRCEGPGCGAEVPMVGLLWLSRKEKQRVALRYHGDRKSKTVRFEIFQPQSESELQPPIVKRFSVTCPVCGYTTPYKRVREQIRAKRGGTRDARMIAVITLKKDGSRGFRLATEADMAVAEKAAKALARREKTHRGPFSLVPDEPTLHYSTFVNRAPIYGISTWGDFFYPRQALALSTFVRLVREAHEAVLRETKDAGFARALATCLAVAVSNLVHYLSSISFYALDHMISAFVQGSGLPMRPDFAEASPLMPKLVGGFEYALEQVVQVLEREGGQGFRPGTVRQASATAMPLPDHSVPYVVTDPPYYYSVQYADCSDFLYVWLKRMLYDKEPQLFASHLTPKEEEIIVQSPNEPPGPGRKNKEFYESMMKRALMECRRVLKPDGVACVLFAHKETAGWEALLRALIDAGWCISASWPIETERSSRMMAQGKAVLASSVFLVCRPRPQSARVGEWREVLAEMNRKVAAWLPRLEEEGIHGADAIFACIGPALESYSRYERVETPAGEVIPLGSHNGKRGYLSYVWEAVAREALRMIFPEADPQGFEEDARVTALWLWTFLARANGAATGEEEPEDVADEAEEGATRSRPTGWALPYDDARMIFQALGAEEAKLKRPGGIIEIQGNTARLLSVMERRRFLMGKPKEAGPRPRRRRQAALFDEPQTPAEESASFEPGQTLLDQLHQAMLLFADGRSDALRRFLVEEGYGKDIRFWRLAEALSRLYPASSREKRLVDGLIARRKSWGV